MKKFVFIILALAAISALYGCGKKQQSLEEMQQPMSMETLTNMNTAAPATVPAEGKIVESKPVIETKVEATQATAPKSAKLEPLPPAGPYKPTVLEVQTALKNAGFYSGAVDGKMGAKTKKAVIEFQKANGLSADGKVGPKTWSALSKHLNPEPAAPKAR